MFYSRLKIVSGDRSDRGLSIATGLLSPTSNIMADAQPPRFAVIAAGQMGSAVAKRLTRAGCTIYTSLDGRSEATRQRAGEAGMLDATLEDIVVKASCILSILPPRDAVSFAEKIRDAAADQCKRVSVGPLVFADCNAVNPEAARRIARILAGTGIKFIDAGIIGGPPRDGYDPTFYASAAPEDRDVLDAFVTFSKYGLKVSPLTGEDVGVGAASALKMSYAVRVFHSQAFQKI